MQLIALYSNVRPAAGRLHIQPAADTGRHTGADTDTRGTDPRGDVESHTVAGTDIPGTDIPGTNIPGTNIPGTIAHHHSSGRRAHDSMLV